MLNVKTDELDLIIDITCDIEKLVVRDENYVVEAPTDILNFIGAFYQKINSPNHINEGTRLKYLVDNVANQLKSNFRENNEIRITTFSQTNPASNPEKMENSIPFMNPIITKSIFKVLPNKTSSGLDEIPPIILKHLPMSIIFDYTIIFNNCLNNKYFPKMEKS